MQVQVLFRALVGYSTILFLFSLCNAKLFAQLTQAKKPLLKITHQKSPAPPIINSARPNAIPDFRSARERAEDFQKTKDYRQAIASYDQWLSAMPRDTTAYLQQALCLMKAAQTEKALLCIERAAMVGLSDYKRLVEEIEFVPLRLLSKWREVYERVLANAQENVDFSFRFCRQERMGRYRILYPDRYDSAQRYNLVLLLHGNGQSPPIMLRWIRELHLQDVIVVCPEAPYAKFPESMYHGAMQLSASPSDISAPDSLRHTVIELSERWYMDVLDDALRSLPLKRDLPIVVGFSQGGFFATVVATRNPDRFRSIVLLSASYFEEAKLHDRAADLHKYGVDVLQMHGRQDPVVPFQTAELIHSALIAKNVETTYVPYEGVHWMNKEVNLKVADWIHSHFQRNKQ